MKPGYFNPQTDLAYYRDPVKGSSFWYRMQEQKKKWELELIKRRKRKTERGGR